MLTYEQALRRVRKATPPPRVARRALHEALGLVLAQRIIAPLDLPPFDNSAVDGYAIRVARRPGSQDAGSANGNGRPIVLRLAGQSSAGSPFCGSVRPDEAVRVFTGAVVPRGTDRIIMQEHVKRVGSQVIVARVPSAGRHIRRRAEDLRRGARALDAGTRLRPQEIGLLAAMGYRRVLVYQPPSVAILATGDELQRPGARLTRGRIYESNGALLAALVRREGARALRLGLVRDVFRRLVARIRLGLRHDILLVAGGVSVGEKDLVRDACKACGVNEIFWQVNIKPGMPLFCGRRGRTLVFGLPGNPVSVFVTFEEFVKPALFRLMGRSWQDGYTEPAVLVNDLQVSPTRRTHFLRVRCSSHNQLVAEPLNGQASHQLHSLVKADGWIRVVSGESPWPAGTQVLVKRETA